MRRVKNGASGCTADTPPPPTLRKMMRTRDYLTMRQAGSTSSRPRRRSPTPTFRIKTVTPGPTCCRHKQRTLSGASTGMVIVTRLTRTCTRWLSCDQTGVRRPSSCAGSQGLRRLTGGRASTRWCTTSHLPSVCLSGRDTPIIATYALISDLYGGEGPPTLLAFTQH
jgi:hypothetical protein